MHYKGHRSAFGGLAGNEQQHEKEFFAVLEKLKQAHAEMALGGSLEDRRRAAVRALEAYGALKAHAAWSPAYGPERVSAGYMADGLAGQARDFLISGGTKKRSR